jgi:site-specific recombinase XerD
MKEQKTLQELISGAVKEMERLKYARLTVKEFRLNCQKFTKFVQDMGGQNIFTEEFGAKYLKERFNYPSDTQIGALPIKVADAVRCIRRLGEYMLYGAFVRNRRPSVAPEWDWSAGDIHVINNYLEAVQTSDNSEATKKLRTYHIKLFYEFLGFRGINGIREMNAQIISDYALSLQGSSPAYVKHRLATLRYYFRFLHKNGYSEQDWSYSVPRVSVYKNLNVPALWTDAEIESLLKSIDRGSPTGKRAYAVILLVVKSGFRVSDIADLRLDNMKWERNEIELVQCKTGKRIVHPLLNDVGWAIIDYIRYARPNVEEPYVFITCNAPYTKLLAPSVGCILGRQMKRCGIQKKDGIVSGMHSLRHALARRLLERGAPLSTIADIMGHTHYSSTSPYLKVDIDGLRECALSLEGMDEYA